MLQCRPLGLSKCSSLIFNTCAGMNKDDANKVQLESLIKELNVHVQHYLKFHLTKS